MADVVLVLNAGSSSLKFSLFTAAAQPLSLIRGQIEGLSTRPRFSAINASGETVGERDWGPGVSLTHEQAVDFLLDWGRQHTLNGNRIVAAGHRVVHGGLDYTRPVRIDDQVLAYLDRLVPLVPLHQPHNLAAIRAVKQRAPELPQIACFDTSFHRTQPPVAQMVAIPRRYADEGVCRYGFHGISYEYIAATLPTVSPRAAEGRTIVAHLGNGASMCAMKQCQSVATTMGFSSLDGIPMGTRCGSIDPGVLLYLIDQHGMDLQALEDLVYRQSGLLGVSGISSDVRVLLTSPDPRAAEALDLFVYRVGRELGSLTAALEGLDAVVFTGGIGENAVSLRQRICQAASWLGLELDEAANASKKTQISRNGSRVGIYVIPTNEELMIARHTMQLLADN
ncbi:MAG: acetate/propionate family kinase [Pirellulales bacterium]